MPDSALKLSAGKPHVRREICEIVRQEHVAIAANEAGAWPLNAPIGYCLCSIVWTLANIEPADGKSPWMGDIAAIYAGNSYRDRDVLKPAWLDMHHGRCI